MGNETSPTVKLRHASDWPLWSTRLAGKLATKKASEAIPHFPGARVKDKEGEVTTITSVAEITATVAAQTKTTAYGYLIDSIHDDLLPLLDDMRDPGAIVDKLYKHFYGASGTALDELNEEFSAMKMNSNEKPDSFAARLNLKIKQITQAGGSVNEKDSSARFRAGLPKTPAWATFTAQVDSFRIVNKRSMTYSELCENAQYFYPTALKLEKLQSGNAHAFALIPRQNYNKRNSGNRRNHLPEHRRPQGNNPPPRPNNYQGQRFPPPPGGNRPNFNYNQHRQQAPKAPPPSPCKHCSGNHWNSDCPRRNNNNNNGKHRVFAVTTTAPEFVIDSGNGGHHVVNDIELIESPAPINDFIYTASGERLPATAQGDLNAVYPGIAVHVPLATANILSVKELTKYGWDVHFTGDQAILKSPEGQTHQTTVTDLYRIHPPACLLASPTDPGATAMLHFHATFGHLRSVPRLRAAAANMNINTTAWPKELPPCTACNKSNINRARVSHAPTTINTDLQVGQRLHCDLAFSDTGHPILDVVDERSRYEMASYPQYKSDTAAAMAQLIDNNYSPQQFDPKETQSDLGGEFTGRDWSDMCRERHIKPTYSAPNTPQHNGLAERTHSVSINMARAMLAAAPHLDANKHWQAAHQLAILIRNLTPMPILGNKCPWELWHGSMPREFPVLLPFGTKVFYHTKDKAKFNQRTAEGLYMGPAIGVVGGAIKVYTLETRKMIITRSYRVEELPSATPPLSAADSEPIRNASPLPDLIDDSDEEDEGFAEPQTVSNRAGNTDDDIDSGPSTPQATPRTLIRQLAATDASTATDPNIDSRELRELRSITAGAFSSPPTSRLRGRARTEAEGEQGEQHQVMLSTADEPNTFKAAMNSSEAADWFAAAQRELVAHYVDAKTFDIVARQPGMREVLSKWVFKKKKNLNNVVISFKGRIVACGYSQVFGVDYFDSSAPVAARDSLRMVLAYAASQNLCIVQADFANAYVNSPLDVSMYMKPPAGMVETLGHLLQPHEIELLQSGNATLKLNKALYGLKQSGLLWYKTLRDHLISLGFQPTASDPCVFVHQELGIIVIIYVDDILVFARTPAEAEQTVLTPLQQHYSLKIIGAPSEFIGLAINQRADGIFLHQQGYSEQVCEKFSDNIHAKSTPMTPGADIDSNGPPGDQQTYMEIVGSLLYASVNTRPDIACATSILSRSMQAPTRAHVRAARTITAYLGNTSNLGILYPTVPGINLSAYCDASHAPAENKRRSRSGIVIFANGAPIIWCSTLQPITASSTAEAEYISLSDGARMLQHAIDFYREIGATIDTPVPVYEDNQTTKRIAEEITTKRSKYIDIRYHQVRDFVERGVIAIHYCPTADMIADMLTKALPRDPFITHRSRLMVKGE